MHKGVCCGIIYNSESLEQCKCSTLGKWLSKLCYIRMMDYGGAVRNHVYKELMT